jgi:putative membrane protein insertion efficiency factor
VTGAPSATGVSAPSNAPSPSDDAAGRPFVAPPPLGPAARVLRRLILLYQAARAGRPSPCRYWPTCSNYGLEAVERHGARRGLWLTARRLARCQPWGGHGVDPVPE